MLRSRVQPHIHRLQHGAPDNVWVVQINIAIPVPSLLAFAHGSPEILALYSVHSMERPVRMKQGRRITAGSLDNGVPLAGGSRILRTPNLEQPHIVLATVDRHLPSIDKSLFVQLRPTDVGQKISAGNI